jgi:hypothetical protein
MPRRRALSEKKLLGTDTARTLLPGLAVPSDDEALMLWLIKVLQELQGNTYAQIGADARAKVLVLAWRYRAQLGERLRRKLKPVFER